DHSGAEAAPLPAGQPSVFAAPAPATVIASPLVAEFAAALAASGQARRWRHEATGSWCHVVPVAHRMPRQGWKLHVSATPYSAGRVLAAALPVLLAAATPFKFVS